MASGPVEGSERSSCNGLGILQTMRLVNDEDGPRKVVKKRYGAPRGVERCDNCDGNKTKLEEISERLYAPTSNRPKVKSLSTRSLLLWVPIYAPTSKYPHFI